jgi:hypothetical protein
MHRAKRFAPRECGWKHGDSGHSAGEKNLCSTKPNKNRLDSDRPSHGRPFHSLTPILAIAMDVWETLIHAKGKSSRLPEGHRFKILNVRFAKQESLANAITWPTGNLWLLLRLRFLKNGMPHLYSAPRRQWDFLQVKKANRKASE